MVDELGTVIGDSIATGAERDLERAQARSGVGKVSANSRRVVLVEYVNVACDRPKLVRVGVKIVTGDQHHQCIGRKYACRGFNQLATSACIDDIAVKLRRDGCGGRVLEETLPGVIRPRHR